MSNHYVPKRSVFAYVSIFYKAKRLKDESVNDYVIRLRQLAKPCNFEANFDNELLRAFVFGCEIEKVKELLSSNDGKSLNDEIKFGLKNEPKLKDLNQIRSAYSSEPTPASSFINYNSFIIAPTNQKSKNCIWCGKEPHDRKRPQATHVQ